MLGVIYGTAPSGQILLVLQWTASHAQETLAVCAEKAPLSLGALNAQSESLVLGAPTALRAASIDTLSCEGRCSKVQMALALLSSFSFLLSLTAAWPRYWSLPVLLLATSVAVPIYSREETFLS